MNQPAHNQPARAKAAPVFQALVKRGKHCVTLLLRVGRKPVSLHFTDRRSSTLACRLMGVRRG